MLAFQHRPKGMPFMPVLPCTIPVCAIVVFLTERQKGWHSDVSLRPLCSEVSTNQSFRNFSSLGTARTVPAGLFFTPTAHAGV